MYRLFFLIPLFFLCSWVNPFSKYEWQSTDNGLKIWTDKGAGVKYHWDGDSRGGVIHGTGTLTISGSQKSSEKINAYYGTINEKGLFNNEAYSQKYIGRLKNWPSSKTEEYDGFGILILKNGDAIISEFEHDFLKSNAETYIYKNDDLIHQGICENSCNSVNIDQDELVDTNKDTPASRCFALCKPSVAPPPPGPGTDEPGNSFDFSILKKLLIALLIILLLGVLAALLIAFPQVIMIILAGLLIAAVIISFALLLLFVIKGMIQLVKALLIFLLILFAIILLLALLILVIFVLAKFLEIAVDFIAGTIENTHFPAIPFLKPFKTEKLVSCYKEKTDRIKSEKDETEKEKLKNEKEKLRQQINDINKPLGRRIRESLDNHNTSGFKKSICELIAIISDYIDSKRLGVHFAKNSDYMDRLGKTPAEDADYGHWSGRRGESWFILNKPIMLPDGTIVDKALYKNCIPDFSQYAVEEVKINMGQERYIKEGNFEQAYKELAEKWNNKKYNEISKNKEWTIKDVKEYIKRENLLLHELNDTKTVQLIPRVIHEIFIHSGGVAECKKG